MAQDLTPLPLDDDDLGNLSEITEQDIIIANQFAARHLDRLYKNLLLAESQELVELEGEG